EREADALARPRLQQAGRVAGDEHPPPAHGRAIAAAAGQMPGILVGLEGREAEPGCEVAQVAPRALALAAGGDHADGEPVSLREHPAIRPWNRPPVEQD